MKKLIPVVLALSFTLSAQAVAPYSKKAGESYSKLPSISFNVIANPEGKTFFVEMPKEAYMRYAKRGEQEGCFLLIHPWDF